MNNKKLALVILDGWGIGDGSSSDAISAASVPFYKSLIQKYPHSTLKTYGEYVGLPEGQMGNSEVGHMNIGAGRVVYQDLVKLNKAVRDNTIGKNPVLIEAFNYALQNKKNVHLLGLVSEGGVHSYQDHLHKLCDLAQEKGLKNVFIHAFTDGRDTDPKSGLGFIEKLEKHIKPLSARIASIVGRYYAMDRDKRWERIKLAYDLMVHGKGAQSDSALKALENSYVAGITDEFIKPVVITGSDNQPLTTIQQGDVVICFNFRTDRCREITQVLTQQDMPDQGMHTLSLHYVTLTNYDENFRNIHVMYNKDNLAMTLGEVIAKEGKKQIRIAETEKYPHVTFFFNGGREEVFEGEKRILINSPKVATYDLQPEMSALLITEAILPEIHQKSSDFICLNFANADMVGHTGNFKAVIKAVETVDACLKRIVEDGIQNGYSFLIIADHGNADYMINPDGSPNTAHSLNPVPCILI
ncbi:MAG TPA: 2,3-bisphosphoglycerate-independent phosphoglycerate mutase, partial [Bacteroidia bacterium]|nr:2,3-bisphosphoglycerate-independent phosphoglycerate mutase [Bacteroidia bacterium]